MTIDFETLDPKDIYKLVSTAVTPRPIAWIVSGKEKLNLAPFSYFTPLSSNPPTLIVSIGHKSDGSPKDTLRNLREYGKCTICLAGVDQVEPLHQSSAPYPDDVNEIEELHIGANKIISEYPPVIKGVKVALFCEYLQEVDLRGSKTIPVIVEIKHIYIDDEVIVDKKQLHFEVDNIARTGAHYRVLGEKIEAPELITAPINILHL